jgi:hypothetical protein
MTQRGIIVVVFLVVVLPSLYYFLYYYIRNRNIKKYYKLLSEKYKLIFKASSNGEVKDQILIEGTFKDLRVEVGSCKKKEGNRKVPLTYVKENCVNHDQFEFVIAKRNMANDVLFGNKAVLMNDREFDEKFIVNTNDFSRFISILNFSIKFKLLQIFNIGLKGELILNGNSMSYSEKGYITRSIDLLRIELVLHLLSEIADELKTVKENVQK